MKQNTAPMIRPTLASGTTTVRTVRIRPQPRLCAASTSVRSTAASEKVCRMTTSGRQRVRYPTSVPIFVLSMMKGSSPTSPSAALITPVLGDDHLPRVDADQVAGEERDDEKEDRPSARGVGEPERERVGAGEGDEARHQGRGRGEPERQPVGVPEVVLAVHADPVDHVETGHHAVVPDQPEAEIDQKPERNQEEQDLPQHHRQAPGRRVPVEANAAPRSRDRGGLAVIRGSSAAIGGPGRLIVATPARRSRSRHTFLYSDQNSFHSSRLCCFGMSR